MRLVSIFIKGFKSFAYPTKIDISKGITAIVGPNGSGKSNIVDAIRWVFGEQSMKTIRADNREDVIFAGSEKNPPANSAVVKLTFEDERGLITIGREITRDGLSQYSINDKPSRLRDIKEIFQGTGVGMDIYSIVGQGQVDKVVTASPYELRALIEEAAGTAIYKEKKKQSLAKLSETEANLNRIEDILFELGKQRKSLYLKAKRAEKYLEYTERLKEVRTLYYGNAVRVEREILNTHMEGHEKVSAELKELQRKLIEHESKWSTLRQEFSEMDKEIEGFTRLLEEYKKRQNDLLELKEMYSKKLSDKESKLIEVSTKLDTLKAEVEDLEKRKDELKLISDGMKQQIEDEEKELKELESIKDSMVHKYSEKEKDWLKLQEELDSVVKRMSKIENELERLSNVREDTQKRLNLIGSQLQSKGERLEDLKKEIEELAAQGKESTEKQKELEENIALSKERRDTLENQLEELKEKIAQSMEELRRSQIERSTLERQQQEYQGFSRAVREIFSRSDDFDGLIDVVANLVEIPKTFETAVSVLLGSRMQDIVVESSITAKRIVAFLKQHKIGRLTLLPLDMLKGNFKRFKAVENHPGFLGYAAKVVDVAEEFKIVPEYLFGSAIVVKSLDDAIDIRKNLGFQGRIVSLDGQLLSAGGAITGGYIGNDVRLDLVTRKRRIQELEQKEKDLQKAMERMQRESVKIKDEIQELRGYIRVLNEELNGIISKGAAINRMIHELLKTANELESEIGELDKLKEEYTKKLNDSLNKREELEEEFKILNQQKKEFEKELQTFSQELKEEKKKLEEIQNQIVDRKLKLSGLYEKQEQYTKELSAISQKKRENSEAIIVLEREIEELENEAEKLRKQVADQDRELQSVKRETEALFSSIRDQRQGKEERLNALQELESEIEALKSEREQKREKLHQFDLLIQESKMRLEQLEKELGEVEGEIPVLSDEELEKTRMELEELENKLKFLGSVDLDAIEEYKLVDAEYQELMVQKEDLEEARQKLIKLIEKIDEEARNRFKSTYEKVNGNFAKYISEIFDGGEGEIRIIPGEDLLESGLEISVRRPGRKFQKLQLFSGGEKALVGIALVFALLSIKPSPFYVLDEVDAPLDDFNAERFKNMLRRHGEDTQFLVITHNKIVMEVAYVLHGITMTDGISRVIPVKLGTIESVIG